MKKDLDIEKLINRILDAIVPVSYNKSGCNCNCGSKNHHHQ
ncbi:hypothetical protein [uncultured Lutibacter sp.]|nr:hypothetical protein [uncultured Lutibacter sp.]